MIRSLLLYIFVAMFCLNLSAQNSDQLIVQILQATGGSNQYQNSVNTILELKKKNYPTVDEEFWTRFQSEIDKNLDIDSLVTEAWKRKFSPLELQEIATFCNTETGSKWLRQSANLEEEILQLIATNTDKIGTKLLAEIDLENEERMKLRQTGCDHMRIGKFFSQQSADVAPIDFFRSQNEQIETLVDGSERRFQVNWLDECRYTLQLKESDGTIDPQTKLLLVNIYEIDEAGYHYAARFEQDKQIFLGYVKRVSQ